MRAERQEVGEGAHASEGGSPGEGHVPYTDPEGSGKRLTGHISSQEAEARRPQGPEQALW